MWMCANCGRIVQQSRAWDEDGNEVFGASDLSDPNNLFNPDSLYWNVEHGKVFCGSGCSLEVHVLGATRSDGKVFRSKKVTL